MSFLIQGYSNLENVNPNNMNILNNNTVAYLSSYFPIKSPSTGTICNGIASSINNYGQRDLSNVFDFSNGVIRFQDQVTNLTSDSSIKACFANYVGSTVTVTCPISATQHYIVAVLSFNTPINPFVTSTSVTISSTAMTLAEIAAQSNPNLYTPLFAISTTDGANYNVFTDDNCAYNYGNSLAVQNQAANLVTAKGTPTFPAGEEYIISPRNFSGEVQQTIVFQRKYINSTSVNYGTSSITFSITHNEAYGSTNYHINVISSNNLPISYFGFKSYLLTAPFTINGNTFGIGNAMVVLYLKKPLPSTNTTNSVYGDYLSTSTGFIDNINLNPVLFEPVAEGTITGSVIDLAFTTNATVEYVVDRYQDVIDNTTTGEVTIGGRIARSAQTMQSTNESGSFSQVRTSYIADAQGTQKPVFNATVSLPTGANATFRSIPAEVGSGYNGWYQAMQNFTSSTIYGMFENYYINATGRQLVGMYATNNGGAGTSISGVYVQSGMRPFLINTANLDKSNPESIAILNDIVNNGVGIVASGVSGGIYWVKYAPDSAGRQFIMQTAVSPINVSTGFTNITLPISFTNVSTTSGVTGSCGAIGGGTQLASFNMLSTNVITVEVNNSGYVYFTAIGY